MASCALGKQEVDGHWVFPKPAIRSIYSSQSW